jgi:hypothetical protein
LRASECVSNGHGTSIIRQSLGRILLYVTIFSLFDLERSKNC